MVTAVTVTALDGSFSVLYAYLQRLNAAAKRDEGTEEISFAWAQTIVRLYANDCSGVRKLKYFCG